MNETSESAAQCEIELATAIAAYWQAVDSGQTPSASDWLERYPRLATELADFFAGQAEVDRLAGPLREFLSAGPLNPATPRGEPTVAEEKVKPAPFEGKQLGDYELLEEIARGGMGVVYRARQISLNRTVAVKMILAGRFATAADVRRFRAEAEAAAGLDHPNIVPIYEIAEQAGHHFFSMKLIEGSSLAQRKRASAGPIRQEMRALATVARAVHYAHQRGILHRDLKPGNILIDAAGQPHVTDFGLAKRVEGPGDPAGQSAPSLEIVGTPSYMAPEQAGRERLTTTADVYSLGAVLYERLTGQPPFRGPTSLDTLVQVRSQEPRRPSSLRAGVDRDLETICLKCLEKEPARRYGSAEALAEDLERWLDGTPILARPSSAWERARKWARRRPALASLVLVIAIALVAGVALLGWGLDHSVKAHAAEIKLRESAQALARAEEDARKAAEGRELEARRQTRLVQGHLALEKGAHRLAEGDVNAGLHWLVRGLEAAPEDADELNHSLRTLLGGWGGTLHRLEHVIDHPGTRQTSFAPGGAFFFTLKPADKVLPLWDAKTGKLHARLEHPNAIANAVFSPDGKLLACACSGGAAYLWNVASRKQVSPALKHTGDVADVAFSPDGKTLATAGLDSDVRLWRVDTGMQLGAPLKHQGPVRSLRFGPWGTTLLTASSAAKNFVATFWDLAGRELLHEVNHVGMPERMALCPHGRSLTAYFGDKLLFVHTGGPGRPPEVREAIQRNVRAIVYSPDGTKVVTGSFIEWDNVIDIWAPSTAKPLATIIHTPGRVDTLALSPDNGQLLVGTEKGVGVWQVAGSARLGQTLLHHRAASPAALAFSPDSKRALVCDERVISIWALEELRPAEAFGRAYFGRKAYSHFELLGPDGKAFLAVWPNMTKSPPVWNAAVRNLENGEDLSKVMSDEGGTHFQRAAFSPDGKAVALLTFHGDLAEPSPERRKQWHEIRAWDSAGTSLGPPLKIDTLDFYPLLKVSPDGKHVLVGGKKGSIFLGNVASGKILDLKKSGASIWVAAFTSDSAVALAGTESQTYLFRTTDGNEEAALPGMLLALSPDGKRCLISQGPQAAIVDVRAKAPIDWWDAHQTKITAGAFSPDGVTVATADARGQTRLWHKRLVPRGEYLRMQTGVSAVAFSADGKLLLTQGTRDARVWDVVTGKPAGPLRRHAQEFAYEALPWRGVSFDPSGRPILQSRGGTVLWSALQPASTKTEDLRAWIEASTGLYLDDGGEVRPLSGGDWEKRLWESREAK